MTENHDIPAHYIPDGEYTIGNQQPEESAEEPTDTDAKRDVCPHCGGEYLDESGGTYIHALVDVSDSALEERLKPGVLCSKNHTRIKHNGYDGI